MNPGSALRALLVDDDDTYVKLVQAAIGEHADLSNGFAVERVADGNHALEYLFDQDGARRPLPDLILLDHHMPRTDGTAVLKAIKVHAETRHIPVCMFSSAMQPKQVRAWYADGASFCVVKPSDFEDLAEKIGQMLLFFRNVVEFP